MKSLRSPMALRKGDTVAVVRPSSRLDRDVFDRSIGELREEGLCVVTYPGKLSSDAFFSSPDEDRASELLWAFKQPGVRAILIARGGYGSQRTLRLLRGHIKKLKKLPPKIVVGYSDATYLLQWVQNQLGWMSFHGPLIGALSGARLKSFVKEIFHLSFQPAKHDFSEVKVVAGGGRLARGRLVGGNLSLLSLKGPAALPQEDIVLVLEDVNENFYRIDRMLRSLLDAGYDRFVKAVICGSFHGCGKDDRKTFGFRRVLETLQELTDGPIWVNARFGHGVQKQRILPLGALVEVRGKRISFREGVVRARA